MLKLIFFLLNTLIKKFQIKSFELFGDDEPNKNSTFSSYFDLVLFSILFNNSSQFLKLKTKRKKILKRSEFVPLPTTCLDYQCDTVRSRFGLALKCFINAPNIRRIPSRTLE